LVDITPSGLTSVTRTSQTVTVTNTSARTLNGPFYLSAESLTPGASLTNRTTTASTGAPAVGLTLGSLAAGAQTQVTLQLDNPTLNPLSYTPAFYGP
jgi:outer membrane lipoprotein-sorting protein